MRSPLARNPRRLKEPAGRDRRQRTRRSPTAAVESVLDNPSAESPFRQVEAEYAEACGDEQVRPPPHTKDFPPTFKTTPASQHHDVWQGGRILVRVRLSRSRREALASTRANTGGLRVSGPERPDWITSKDLQSASLRSRCQQPVRLDHRCRRRDRPSERCVLGAKDPPHSAPPSSGNETG